jgi:polyhydroxyalkanoate synthesis regulator phasin
MASSSVRVLTLVLVLGTAACRHPAGPGEETAPADADTLTRVVAELRMHLRDDTYRQARPRTADGRDLFAAILWKLDRLQQERATPPVEWQNTDYVIEFARARVLEKQRRYAQAQLAYERVAARAGTMQQAAREGAQGVGRLAALAGETRDSALDELTWLEARIRLWSDLAWEMRTTRWEPLAQEEAEAWEMLRVERLATAGELEAAIEAGRKLAEHHRHSKLYARHLIALGDLHADAARALEVEKRVRSSRVEIEARREDLVERAFSAYELASEARGAEDRLSALARIEALRADREGGLSDAR